MSGPVDLTFEEYLAHPALSASGAKRLLEVPQRYAYDRENPSESSKYQNLGTVAHTVVLGTGKLPVELQYDDWRTTAARSARDDVLRVGGIPLLSKDFAVVRQMAAALRAHPLAAALLTGGNAEQSYLWDDPETGCPCKARLDYIVRKGGTLVGDDYKTTTSANPDTFAGHIRRYRYDLQAANNLDAVKAGHGELGDFLFIAQEKDPPYLVSVVRISDSDLSDAYADLEKARSMYVQCTRTGVWAGYGGPYTVELPRRYDRVMEDA